MCPSTRNRAEGKGRAIQIAGKKPDVDQLPHRPEASTGNGAERTTLREDLGPRLRAARLQKNIGLRELARRLGLSSSLISQIENGKSRPSINTLFAIVGELEIPVNEIVFDLTQSESSSSSAKTTDPMTNAHSTAFDPDGLQSEAAGSPVQPRGSRLSISLENNVSWQRLTPQPDHNVDFLLLRYGPGGESTPADSLMRHNGTEYGYVLSGRLQVSLGFDTYELGPGDSIAFDCTQPHRFATIGDEAVEAVWFVVGRRSNLSIDGSRTAGR